MARGIQLQRSEITSHNHWEMAVWRLRIDVIAVNGGMDSKVFVWTRGAAPPGGGSPVDTFMTVANVALMATTQADEPASGETLFRTDWVELDFHSQADYDAAWTDIKTAVEGLTTSLDKADVLTVAETVWLGESP